MVMEEDAEKKNQKDNAKQAKETFKTEVIA